MRGRKPVTKHPPLLSRQPSQNSQTNFDKTTPLLSHHPHPRPRTPAPTDTQNFPLDFRFFTPADNRAHARLQDKPKATRTREKAGTMYTLTNAAPQDTVTNTAARQAAYMPPDTTSHEFTRIVQATETVFASGAAERERERLRLRHTQYMNRQGEASPCAGGVGPEVTGGPMRYRPRQNETDGAVTTDQMACGLLLTAPPAAAVPATVARPGTAPQTVPQQAPAAIGTPGNQATVSRRIPPHRQRYDAVARLAQDAVARCGSIRRVAMAACVDPGAVRSWLKGVRPSRAGMHGLMKAAGGTPRAADQLFLALHGEVCPMRGKAAEKRQAARTAMMNASYNARRARWRAKQAAQARAQAQAA